MAKNDKTPTRVRTPRFRVAFPHVFKPQQPRRPTQDPKYSLVALFAKGADLSELRALAKAAAKERWGDNVKGIRSPFRDGGEKAEQWDGFEPGATFITLSSKFKPGLVDKNGGQELVSDTEFYGGCYAMATVNAYTYDTDGNRGVAFGLQNIIKLADGDPFSSRVTADEDFKDLVEEGDGDSGNASGAGDDDDEMFS